MYASLSLRVETGWLNAHITYVFRIPSPLSSLDSAASLTESNSWTLQLLYNRLSKSPHLRRSLRPSPTRVRPLSPSSPATILLHLRPLSISARTGPHFNRFLPILVHLLNLSYPSPLLLSNHLSPSAYSHAYSLQCQLIKAVRLMILTW